MAKDNNKDTYKNPIKEVANTFVSSPKYQKSTEQMGFGELMDDTYDNPNNKNKKYDVNK